MNYLDKLKHLTQRPDTGPTIQVGDWIEWRRIGTVQQGLVDFIHDATDGTRWAFVTLADTTWAAVNVRYTTHPPVSPDIVTKRMEGA
jgi:hypothetical protein